MPSDTASAIVVTSRAPAACAASASAGISSSTPKKFGDCTTTAAAFCQTFLLSAPPDPSARTRCSQFPRSARPRFFAYVASTCRYSGCTDRATSTRWRPVSRSAISTASVSAVEPSYIDAFATSWPGELAHQRLKFEDCRERALRNFRLIRSVGSEKFAALDQRVGHHRAHVLVNARAEKRSVAARILRRARLEILDDLRLRKRPGQRKRFAQSKFFGNRLEKFFNRFVAPIASSISLRSEGLLGR